MLNLQKLYTRVHGSMTSARQATELKKRTAGQYDGHSVFQVEALIA
jgi:hypothetical protein